ncbi:MAG: 50S ribosomal protein L30 [Clostridia bacterium]|nr:50S ribosomal protein L30 [Clostridia bacterium]MDE6598154.1 50S ribosomal protein L30 [Clostridia bacterium]MDE7306608.1 50S ribosomal protein L30 [Clostridia bacterium]
MVKVTLVKSASNETKTVKNTVAALGLKKIGQNKTFEETPANMGQIKKVGYLLKVEKV